MTEPSEPSIAPEWVEQQQQQKQQEAEAGSSVMQVAGEVSGKAAAEAGIAGLTPGKATMALGCPPDLPLGEATDEAGRSPECFPGRVATENPVGRSPLKTQRAGLLFLCSDLGRGIAPGLLIVGLDLRRGDLLSSRAAPRGAHPT